MYIVVAFSGGRIDWFRLPQNTTRKAALPQNYSGKLYGMT